MAPYFGPAELGVTGPIRGDRLPCPVTPYILQRPSGLDNVFAKDTRSLVLYVICRVIPVSAGKQHDIAESLLVPGR